MPIKLLSDGTKEERERLGKSAALADKLDLFLQAQRVTVGAAIEAIGMLFAPIKAKDTARRPPNSATRSHRRDRRLSSTEGASQCGEEVLNGTRTAYASARLPAPLHAELNALLEGTGISLSYVIQTALRDYLDGSKAAAIRNLKGELKNLRDYPARPSRNLKERT